MIATITIRRPYTSWPAEELVPCVDCGEPTPEREPGNDRCGWCRGWRKAVAEDLDDAADEAAGRTS